MLRVLLVTGQWQVSVVCGEASAVLLVPGDDSAAATQAALSRCTSEQIAWEGGDLGEEVWVEQVVPTVTLTLRRDDWDLFRETLENDALSTAFDSELREALTAALRRTKEHD